ncbi:MAG: VOC family protein [Pseudomonadota bacterium]
MPFKLNHVALTVEDRERSALFYSRWFGLTNRLHEDDHLLILSNDTGALLALSAGEKPRPLPRTTHFGFQVDNAEMVHDIRHKFRAAGIEEAEWQEAGPTRVQVFDPDGYRVEVYGWS